MPSTLLRTSYNAVKRKETSQNFPSTHSDE
jgi:hypothetical protein